MNRSFKLCSFLILYCFNIPIYSSSWISSISTFLYNQKLCLFSDVVNACVDPDITKLQNLLEIGVNPNRAGHQHRLPLVELMRKYGSLPNKHIEKRVRMLLKAGADPNAKEFRFFDSSSPLATIMDNTYYNSCPSNIVKILLAAGANPDVGKPLMKAVMWGHTKIVKMLLDKGANPNIQWEDLTCNTALMCAMHPVNEYENQKRKIVKLLLKAGARLDTQNNWGWTALMGAALRGCTEIVKTLLENGADPNIVCWKSGNGFERKTARMWATMNGYQKTADVLQAYEDVQQAINPAIEIRSVAREPKPEDYIPYAIHGGYKITEKEFEDMIEKDEDRLKIELLDEVAVFEEGIRRFEEDKKIYWQQTAKEAYDQFVQNNNRPLQDLFFIKLMHRPAEILDAFSAFKSPLHAQAVLHKIATSPDQKIATHKIINMMNQIKTYDKRVHKSK